MTIDAPTIDAPKVARTAKDYASDQEVRWCPGCGDYAILKAVQKTLAKLQVRPEETVFVSGIGCAARFPYYLSTYGFHTIHGRAPAIATGLKLANPDLDVWVVSGDGDALSIGGNHLLHLLRRNVNLQFLLFNNEIYGLTKGQASPTSRLGTRSPSTPGGSREAPVSATLFALGAGARFVARSVDTLQTQLPEVLERAHAYAGTSFVEILQNCIVYNDKVFQSVTEKAQAPDSQLHLVHGQPLVFGAAGSKALRLAPGGLALEVVATDQVEQAEILLHDETNRALAGLLAAMAPPDFPVALGVLYRDPVAQSFEASAALDPASIQPSDRRDDLTALLRSRHTWQVPAEG